MLRDRVNVFLSLATATVLSQSSLHIWPIGVGNGFAVPALRTVRAVLPHTALQSVVSSSGLAR